MREADARCAFHDSTCSITHGHTVESIHAASKHSPRQHNTSAFQYSTNITIAKRYGNRIKFTSKLWRRRWVTRM